MTPGWKQRVATGAIAVLMTVTGCAGGQQFDARRLALPEPSREIATDVVGKLATLDNGIRVFVVQDPKAALVEFDVRHHVGSRDDPQALPGLAHVVEHLMFEVEAEGSVPIMLDLPNHALYFNAYTSADNTHYQQLGPAKSLDAFIRHAEARLRFDCEALAPSVLARELEVVRNELRMRQDGVAEALYRAIYPPKHPYRNTLTREEDSVARITREDVCAFVERFYNPATTDIIITGDVEPQHALQQIKARLGSLRAKPVRRTALQPFRTKARSVKVVAPVEEPTVVLAYALPPAGSVAAIEASIAWRTADSLLPILLPRRKHRRARSAYFMEVGGREAPLLVVAVEPVEGETDERAASEIRAVIADIFATGIPAELYDRARQRIRREVLESVASTLQSADAYADALSSDPPRFYGDDLYVLDSLTPQRLQEVGMAYLDESRGMKISLVPDPKSEEAGAEVRTLGQLDPGHGSARTTIDPAEAKRPLPYDGPPTEIERSSFQLANGLDVVLLQTTDFPLMEATLIVHSGQRDAEVSDVPLLVPFAYRPDFATREALELADAFERSGAVMFKGPGPSSLTYRARGLSVYFDMLLAWFSEATLNAVPVTDTAFYYRNAILDLVEGEDGEELLQRNRVRRAIWGETHPNTLASAVTRRELRKVTDGDIRRWHQAHFRADNATLVIAGGFDAALVRDYVEVYFGDRKFRRPDINRWNRPSEPRSRPTVPAARPGSTRVFTYEDADALQLHIEMSFPLGTTRGVDRAALLILAEMLDAHVQSLRRELGVAYSFNAIVDDADPRIAIVGQVDGRRAAEATPALLESLERLRAGDDFDRRFARARRVVLHRAILDRTDPNLFSEAVVHALQVGNTIEQVLDRPRQVATATPGQLRDVIQRVMPHERSVTILRGTRAALAAAREAAGFGAAEELEASQGQR